MIAFIFADLIIIPILNIHRKYYGGRMGLYLFFTSYLAMALVGLLIGLLFQALGLSPTHRHIAVFETSPSWNITTWLDLAALVMMAVFAWRFFSTGGGEMIRMMERSDGADHDPGHHSHTAHGGA